MNHTLESGLRLRKDAESGMFRKEELAEATDELEEAALWFDDSASPRGDEFLYYIDSAVSDILDMPESWAKVPDWDGEPILRSHKVEKFPYRVIYYIKGDAVFIIAYANT
jgi:toxin ParE1/3/4